MSSDVQSDDDRDRGVWAQRQAWLLRLAAVIDMLAFPWVVVPRSWMEASHAWLGMGEMPAGAVVDFTIRQSAFFYGMHGVLLWWLSRDVVRFQPIVRLIGWTYLIFGPVFFLIDWTSGTPSWWTWCDPLVTAAFGSLVLAIDRQLTLLAPRTSGSAISGRHREPSVPRTNVPNADQASRIPADSTP